MDTEVVNYAKFLAGELRAMCIKGKQLYVTGNMQRSIAVVSVNENFIDIVIATDYASYTDTRGKMRGWIGRTVDRASRCYAQANQVNNELINGLVTNIYYGG